MFHRSLLILAILFSASLWSAPSQQRAEIIQERDELFMLATLSYLYNVLPSHPRPGYDIASLIAWDVEDITKEPEFVIERNRNFEMQGEIYHAEINTMRKAFLKKKNFQVSPSFNPRELYLDYTYRLANTTLYTSLEPCLMCAMSILVARVPRVIYFMEDPLSRDPETHNVFYPLPREAYGRHVETSLSSLSLAQAVRKEMEEDVRKTASLPYIQFLPDGRRIINTIDYIRAQGKRIFRSAYKQLSAYSVKFEENRKLFESLKRGVGLSESSSSGTWDISGPPSS